MWLRAVGCTCGFSVALRLVLDVAIAFCNFLLLLLLFFNCLILAVALAFYNFLVSTGRGFGSL